MPKTIAAVRAIEPFLAVFMNPAKQLQALVSALRSCTLEADRAILKSVQGYGCHSSLNTGIRDYTTIAESLSESFLVDRRPRMSDNEEQTRRTFKGYRDASRDTTSKK